ncbi:hypothetical protein [Dactylosporangium sp. NPDC048998]|uniref:hypothetical protein n=1 Tax=Dactylosporangium sp. NPDC048998 TaxID=3363976 RepID=UPI003713CCF8
MTTHVSRPVHADPGEASPALRAAVAAVLTQLEASLDRHGWDQPPALIGIFRHPQPQYVPRTAGVATTDRSARTGLSTVEFLVEVDAGLVGPATWHRPDSAQPAINLHPVDVLLRLPDELAGPAMRTWLHDWLHLDGRRLVGFGFCFEGWQAPIRPGYRHGDLANARADQRTEVRAIAALDVHGHAWQLIRPRSATRPELTTSDTTGWRIAASRVLTGLHRLNQLGRAR